MKCQVSIVVLTLIIAILGSCSKSTYQYDEAIRSLKVLNSDMTNFFSTASERDEFKALNFLWENPSAPVPFQKEKFTAGKPFQNYDFELKKGVYVWDSISSSFRKTDNSENVEINFAVAGIDSNFRFIIASFAAEEISSRPRFPVNVNAGLWKGANRQLEIIHTAKIADDLPLKLNTTVRGSDFSGNAEFERTRKNDRGKVKFMLKLEKEKTSFITLWINAEIGYGSTGYYFEKIDFESRLFGHLIKGFIDYGNINPTSEDYVKSWNENTNIEMFEIPFNRKVGNIVLGKTGNGDLQDYFIRFSNGKQELLSGYLPFLKKILDFKY